MGRELETQLYFCLFFSSTSTLLTTIQELSTLNNGQKKSEMGRGCVLSPRFLFTSTLPMLIRNELRRKAGKVQEWVGARVSSLQVCYSLFLYFSTLILIQEQSIDTNGDDKAGRSQEMDRGDSRCTSAGPQVCLSFLFSTLLILIQEFLHTLMGRKDGVGNGQGPGLGTQQQWQAMPPYCCNKYYSYR